LEDESQSRTGIDQTETVFIKVEPDINVAENLEDNLLPDHLIENDWENQEIGELRKLITLWLASHEQF
jgi:hypothetical protein